MSILSLKNISKRYRLGETDVVALQDIDLEVAQGEFLVVWGASGSGKSTLLNLMATLDTPDTGTLCFDGRDISGLSDTELTRLRQTGIGVIFQSFNLVPVLSALENVMLPLQIRGAKSAEVRAKAEQLLNEVGVGAHAHQRPDQLSGGQRQRVAIARALITSPKVVVADEPTANLDSDNTHRIIELMRELNRQHGTTFVFSTHDPILLDTATRRVQLRDGRIVAVQGAGAAPFHSDIAIHHRENLRHAHDAGLQKSVA